MRWSRTKTGWASGHARWQTSRAASPFCSALLHTLLLPICMDEQFFAALELYCSPSQQKVQLLRRLCLVPTVDPSSCALPDQSPVGLLLQNSIAASKLQSSSPKVRVVRVILSGPRGIRP